MNYHTPDSEVCKMKTHSLRRLMAAVCCCMLAFAPSAFLIAQSGGTFNITKSVIAGGGGTSSGGTFGLEGTIGQPVAGGPANGAPFSIYSGFWTPGIAGWNIIGEIIYGTSTGKRVPRVDLALTGSSTGSVESNLSGAYAFNGLADGGNYTITPTKTAQEDVSGIASFDAAQVARHVAGLITLNANQQVAGDASNNGILSSLDAAQIARFAASFTTNIGFTGQWKFLPPSRTYNSLSNDAADENYTGILVGEVSGNWTQPSSLAEEVKDPETEIRPSRTVGKNIESVTAQTNIGAVIPIEIPDTSASNGSVVTIPINTGQIDDADAVFSYDFRISFDPAILTPASPAFSTTGTITGSQVDTWTITPNTSTPGLLVISAFTTGNEINGPVSGPLINLRFNVVGSAGQSTSLTWTAFSGCPLGFCYNEGIPVATPDSGGMFTVTGPTASSAQVTGRVLTADGRAIRMALVSIYGPTGHIRTVSTNMMGHFRFIDISVGENYVVSVTAKNRTFATSSILVPVKDNIEGIIFTADASTTREDSPPKEETRQPKQP